MTELSVGTRPLHLVKLVLNHAHFAVNKALRDINSMHQALTSFACPPDFGPSSRAAAGLLYRVERTAAGFHILLQTATQPDPAALGPGFTHAGTRDLTPLLVALQVGTAVRYRITVNATTTRISAPDPALPPLPDGKPRRPRGVLNPLTGDAAVEWWHAKALRHGLERTTISTVDSATLRGQKGKHKITVAATTIEGTARVSDADALHAAVRSGIGRARSYGCGLLTLAPLQMPDC